MSVKYVFVTGGVVSGLGKGITAASLGRLLKARGFKVTIREVKVNAGAGFLVAKTGDIMTMPGLPKVPAAERIDIDENGVISGLF